MTGAEFRTWRRSKEISQQEVAKSVKCSVSTISRWEKSELNITTELYERIINYYESVANCD